MKTIVNIGALLFAGVLLLSSCQRSGNCAGSVENPYEVGRGDLVVSSNIVKSSTRVAGEVWEVSDAIGIYATNGGQVLGAGTVYDGNANRKYTTAKSGTTVNFTSVDGVTVPSEGTVDLVAYYPYTEGTAFEYSFDTSDQSNLSAIDVLYSNNQKGVSKTSNQANLVFKHALTLIEFNINSVDGMAIDATSTVSLANVLVDGSMTLADGKVTTGSKMGNPTATVKLISGTSYRAMVILPPQNLNGKEVTFTFNGRAQKATLSLAQTQSGYKYVVDVNYTKGAVIVVDGATINPWTDGGSNGDPIVVIGGGDTPDPVDPDPDPTPGKLLAPGSNFDDWDAFKAALNTYGLKDYATQVDGGVTGKAMLIKGTPTANDYVFTFKVPEGAPTSGKNISLYIKGTAGKSLSFNVYKTDGKAYTAFNLGTVAGTTAITLEPADSNQYTGTIDTSNEWVKVTLNISGLELATKDNFFALKVGKEVAYDLMIDDITIE